MTFFVEKGFTNCDFEKLCSSENTSFIVFSAKHSSCTKMCFLCLFSFCFGFVFLLCFCFVVGLFLVLLLFSYFSFLLSFYFFCFFCLFFGGFKGQVRSPKRPPHLALNPPYFLFFVCFLEGLRVR